jgi:hypothetical protein
MTQEPVKRKPGRQKSLSKTRKTKKGKKSVSPPEDDKSKYMSYSNLL